MLFLLTCEAPHTRKPFLSKTPSFARSHCIFILWLLSQPVENVKSKVTSGFNDLPPLQYQTLWYASLRSRSGTWSYVFYRVGYSRPSYQGFLTSAMSILRRQERKQRTFLKGTPSFLSLFKWFFFKGKFQKDCQWSVTSEAEWFSSYLILTFKHVILFDPSQETQPYTHSSNGAYLRQEELLKFLSSWSRWCFFLSILLVSLLNYAFAVFIQFVDYLSVSRLVLRWQNYIRVFNYLIRKKYIRMQINCGWDLAHQ